MDPVTLVMTALAAGAAKGVGDSATAAVKDAYAKLKMLLAARFEGEQSRELVLEQHERQPEVWRVPMVQAVTETGADRDPAVVEMARRLLELLDEAGARSGKYAVDLRGSQGVQLGEGNTQINTFTAPER